MIMTMLRSHLISKRDCIPNEEHPNVVSLTMWRIWKAQKEDREFYEKEEEKQALKDMNT